MWYQIDIDANEESYNVSMVYVTLVNKATGEVLASEQCRANKAAIATLVNSLLLKYL